MFYLDGEYCGPDPKHLEKCIEDKLGKLCSEKLNQHKANKTTSSTSRATIIEECGNKEFWLCKGTDTGSKAELENCLRKDQEASCVAEQENARETGHTGKFGPLPGPGKCGDVKWICEKTFVSEQNYYINCDTPAKKPPESVLEYCKNKIQSA